MMDAQVHALRDNRQSLLLFRMIPDDAHAQVFDIIFPSLWLPSMHSDIPRTYCLLYRMILAFLSLIQDHATDTVLLR